MHELSIAQNILDIVHQHVAADDERTVRSVKLRIGEHSGVVAESLQFCFSTIVAATSLEAATLDIEVTPFCVRCARCQKNYRSEFGIVTCPACGSSETEIVSGTEMQVVEIELGGNGTV